MRLALVALVTAFALANAAPAGADVPYWQYRYPFSPFARAIAVDPTNPDVVWVGASNAATPYGELGAALATGVFVSNDGGATFAARNAGLPSLHVTALAVDPSSPNVVYAGTVANGVAKSTDGGLTWVAANAGLTQPAIRSLAIHPTTPTTLYAGTTGGAFRSTDGGASWSASTGIATTTWAFAVHPAAPATVYAATGGGVAKSTDGGAAFVKTGAFTVPPNQGNTGPVVSDVRAVVVDATAPDTLLAGAHEGGGVFRSTDGGASWTHSSTGLKASELGNWRFVHALAQDPLTPAVFYASTSRQTYRSVDGGTTWTPFSAGLSRGEMFALGVHPSGRIYGGSVFGELHRLQVKPSVANHFRCFKASGKGFTPQPIAFDDGYGTGPTIAVRPIRYCVPTAPASEQPVDPSSHLVCYKTAKVPFASTLVWFLSQRIDGYRAYQLDRSDAICVPASVDAPVPVPHDAYRCLDGPSWKSTPLDLTLVDALGTQPVVQHRMDRLCVPTDLDGTDVREPGVDLRCDAFKKPMPRFTATTVTTTDRFGTQTLRLRRPDSHCFPALESRD